jgi:hypothetical protein
VDSWAAALPVRRKHNRKAISVMRCSMARILG